MGRMKTAASGLCLMLAGCNVLPVANYDRDVIIATAKERGAKINKMSIDDARLLAVGWRDTLETATITRRNQMLIAEEVLYYGTLVLMGAQAAIANEGAGSISRDLRHARNLGATAALGSNLFSTHYNTAAQQPAFEKAAARMRCLTDAIVDISAENKKSFDLTNRAEVIGVDDQAFTELESEAPRKIVQFIERKSVPDLRAALGTISLGLPTRDELERAIKDYRSTDVQALADEAKRRSESDHAPNLAKDAVRLAKEAEQAKLLAQAKDSEVAQLQTKSEGERKGLEQALQELAELKSKMIAAKLAAEEASKEADEQAKKEETAHRYVLAVKLLSENLEMCAVIYPQ